MASVATHQVLRSNREDSYGFNATFYTQDRKVMLEVEGVDITTYDRRSVIAFTLRSSLTDFEDDSMHLLDAELVASETQWSGNACWLKGVLTKFTWRTEKELTEEMKKVPSGDGIYTPKLGPLPSSHETEEAKWNGEPFRAIMVEVRITSR